MLRGLGCTCAHYCTADATTKADQLASLQRRDRVVVAVSHDAVAVRRSHGGQIGAIAWPAENRDARCNLRSDFIQCADQLEKKVRLVRGRLQQQRRPSHECDRNFVKPRARHISRHYEPDQLGTIDWSSLADSTCQSLQSVEA